MMRRISTIILLMAACFVMRAEKITVDDITYEIKNGAAIVYQGGAELESAVIPASVSFEGQEYAVTSIRAYAFYGHTALKTVSIPGSVTSIGFCSFDGCSSLASIEIPGSVTKIDQYAFYNCAALKEVTIADSNDALEFGSLVFHGASVEKLYLGRNYTYVATSPEYGPFAKQTALKELTIGSSVTSIFKDAFLECTGLTSAVIPNSVTSIGENAFYGCSALTSVEIPNSLTSISENTFNGCSALTSVEIPNSVTSIGESAFSGCSALTSVVIPRTVTKISRATFSGCSSLVSVEIPNSVIEIADEAFSGCNIDKIISAAIVAPEIDITSFSQYAKFNAAVDIPARSRSSYEEKWNSFRCFSNYDSHDNTAVVVAPGKLSLELPENLRGSITGLKVVGKIDAADIVTLNQCPNLMYLDLTEASIVAGGPVDDWEHSMRIRTSDNVLDKTWCYNLRNLIWVGLPTTLHTIGTYAFHDEKSLFEVAIPPSVSNIGEFAFAGCSALGSIEIPGSLTELTTSVFNGCASLTSVIIPGAVTKIGNAAFCNCFKLRTVEIPNSVTKIGPSSFTGCIALESINLPESLTFIGQYTFHGCRALTSIVIPDEVVELGNAAFRACSNLTSVVIGQSVTKIGEYAFSGCGRLASVKIPGWVTEIGYEAFEGCLSLTAVYYDTESPIEVRWPVFEEDIYEKATLYTTEKGAALAADIEPWKNFSNIVVYDFSNSGVEEIVADFNSDAPCEIYNLSGIRVGHDITAVAPGIYIVRQGNVVTKIAVR